VCEEGGGADIIGEFVTHIRESSCIFARFEVFTAATMKNTVFWDIKTSSYFTGDTLRLLYRAQSVNVM
jgi:hypothetical protein